MERVIVPERSTPPNVALGRYHEIPKHFAGPETADHLLSIYESLVGGAPRPSYFFAAGSAAAESGLVGTHLDTEERHRRIQCGHDAWKFAQKLSIDKHIDDNWTESKLLLFSDRVETQLIFTTLLHDMVNGDVRPETMASTHRRLVQLGVTNLQLYNQATRDKDPGAISGRRGLANEIAMPAAITRLQCPSYFAMPTVARADNGTYMSEDTHDAIILEQSWGSIRSTIPCEIKSKGGLRPSKRYKSAMIRGTVHLRMPSATSSLHLAKFLDKEIRGEATAQEITELNEVTSKVLREATKYLQQQKLARETLSSLAGEVTS